MGVFPFIVEGGVPAEIVGRDVHCCGDVVAVRAEQIPPRLGTVVAQPHCILPLQGDNVGPHISGVLFQFRHGALQVHTIFVTKQAVAAQPLCAGTGSDVPGVALHVGELVPVRLQSQCDERRCIALCGLCSIVLILIEGFAVRKIFRKFVDELLLLACGRTVVWQQFHPFPRGDVAQVAAERSVPATLVVGTFDDQSCHSSPSSQTSRTRWSRETRPLVFFTLLMLSARRRLRSSSLN